MHQQGHKEGSRAQGGIPPGEFLLWLQQPDIIKEAPLRKAELFSRLPLWPLQSCFPKPGKNQKVCLLVLTGALDFLREVGLFGYLATPQTWARPPTN